MSLSAQPNHFKIGNTCYNIDEQNENSETSNNFNPDKEELRQKRSSCSSQSLPSPDIESNYKLKNYEVSNFVNNEEDKSQKNVLFPEFSHQKMKEVQLFQVEDEYEPAG